MKNLENNKLIADFMNVQPIQYDEHYQWSDGVYFSISGVEKDKVLQHIYEYVKYVSSWDWIMPVVVKCFNILEETEQDSGDLEYKLNDALLETNIERLYKTVIEIINYYNKNK